MDKKNNHNVKLKIKRVLLFYARVSTYEKLNKENIVLCVLERKLVILQQNVGVTQSLLNIKKGLVPFTCIPPSFVDLEDNNELTCQWVHNCPFGGLGFKLLWVGEITSCKHVYHGWCAFVHFNKSTKCIDILCGENMHKGQWILQ
jgi:hypothetical protein